jgi:hypothetical protein
LFVDDCEQSNASAMFELGPGFTGHGPVIQLIAYKPGLLCMMPPSAKIVVAVI